MLLIFVKLLFEIVYTFFCTAFTSKKLSIRIIFLKMTISSIPMQNSSPANPKIKNEVDITVMSSFIEPISNT